VGQRPIKAESLRFKEKYWDTTTTREGQYRVPVVYYLDSLKREEGLFSSNSKTERFNESLCCASKVFNGETLTGGFVCTSSGTHTYVNASSKQGGRRHKHCKRSCKRSRVIILLFLYLLLICNIGNGLNSKGGVEYFGFIPLYFDNSFVVSSQLNGANGEVTMFDDMEMDGTIFGGKMTAHELKSLERSRREAENHKHKKPKNGGSRSSEEIEYGKRQDKKKGGKPSSVLIPEPTIVEEPKIALPAETFACYVIPSTHQLYEIQGATYSSIPDGFNVFTGTEEFVTRDPAEGAHKIIGRKILVQSCGIGWFIRSSYPEKNKVNYVTSAACTLLINDGFTYRDTNNRLVSVEKNEFVIYKPLMNRFIKDIRTDKLTDFALQQGSMIMANSTYIVDGLPDHPIIVSTFEAYKHWVFRRGMLQNSTQTRRFITMNYDALGYHETQHALHEEAWIKENHILVDSKLSPWTEESITTSTLSLLSWEPRADFEIVKNVGVDISTGRFDFGNDGKYPTRLKITKFFSFEGLGLVPFNKHTRNNENLSHGCKRLIGCRGTVAEEAQLRTSAVHFAHFLYPGDVDASAFEKRIMLKCIGGRKFVYDFQKLPIGLGHFISDSFAHLKSRVTPSFMSRKMNSFKTWMHTAKYSALENWYDYNPIYGRTLWAKVPNARMKQREEFIAGRHYHYAEYSNLKSMKLCIKDEMGKFGKPSRVFLNLDTESAYAPTLPMHMKMLLHGTHMYQLTNPITNETCFLEVFIYAQPDPTQDELNYVARKVNEARFLDNYLFVAIHSDDSCMSGNIRGRKILSNNDVSSNDAGQDAPAFYGMAILQGLLSELLAEGLLDLACLPIDIPSPTSEAFLRLKFSSPFEPSGHSNTSCWNHLGSLFISLSIFHTLVMTDLPFDESVSKGAALVGHVMTVEVCECMEDIQFLKFSPVFINEEWVMSANLGRVFRRLGAVDNDLTHLQLGVDLAEFRSMTAEERMNRFWSGVILGLKHEPSNVILDALRSRFDSSRHTVTESALSLVQDEKADSYYMHSRTRIAGDCTASIMRRYRLHEYEVEELVSLIHDLSVGKRYKLTSIAKMFEKDYGVSKVHEPLPHTPIGTEYEVVRAVHRRADSFVPSDEEKE